MQVLRQEIAELRMEMNTSSQVSESMLSPFLSPLEAQISELNDTVTKLGAEIPLGHVFGDGSTMVPASQGSLVSNWRVITATDFSPILKGDMTFDGTFFTVPTSGIYYIYCQVLSEATEGAADCGFRIEVGADIYMVVSRTTGSGEKLSHYSSQVRRLTTGQFVSIRTTTSGCVFNFGLDRAFFGLFRLLD
jgi:hypothetical protein